MLSQKTISYIGRTGYTAKGIVYGLFGLLALQAAYFGQAKPEGTKSTFFLISRQPFGQVLLVAVALGLFAFVAWRGIQTVLDPEDKGSDSFGWARRVGCGISGLLYLGLALSGLGVAFGSGGGGSSDSQRAAWILSVPGGQLLVILAGLIVVGVGGHHFYRSYTAKFMKSYDLSAMSPEEKTWAERLGRYGLAARGVTFLIIGGFLLEAGITYDPSKVGGLGKAFDSLSRQTYGQVLFAIVAAGFVAYGIYCLSRARYKQFFKREDR